MKAISVNVFKNTQFSKCSNGGVSEQFDNLLILCENGHIEVTGEEKNLCKIVKRDLFGKDVYHIRPIENPQAWYMFGGSFAHSSDSRFTNMVGDQYGAISIHDRLE